MTTYLRLTKTEQQKIDDLAHEINKRRIEAREKPVADSKVLHQLVGYAIEKVEVDATGNLYYRKLAGLVR